MIILFLDDRNTVGHGISTPAYWSKGHLCRGLEEIAKFPRNFFEWGSIGKHFGMLLELFPQFFPSKYSSQISVLFKCFCLSFCLRCVFAVMILQKCSQRKNVCLRCVSKKIVLKTKVFGDAIWRYKKTADMLMAGGCQSLIYQIELLP